MKSIIIFLFSISLVSAISVELDCPTSAKLNEEFTCPVDFKEVDGIYDLKIELLNNGKSIAKIYDSSKNSWISAYYYLNGFITEDGKKELRLKIKETGEFEGKIKVRKKSPKNIGIFNITILEETVSAKKEEKNGPENKKEPTKEKTEKEKFPLKKSNGPITLNEISLGSGEEQKEILVYESKNFKILRYTPYFFSLFLIFIIILMSKQR